MYTGTQSELFIRAANLLIWTDICIIYKARGIYHSLPYSCWKWQVYSYIVKSSKFGCVYLLSQSGNHRSFRYLLIRLVSRDIGGSDPERMAPPNAATFIQEVFKDSPIKVVLTG